MENERLLVAAGLTAAAVVGAFVFWGPSTGHSGRGRLAGLVNLGKTCFLNAILHALAACPQFVSWLEQDRLAKETSLRSTLSTVLSGNIYISSIRLMYFNLYDFHSCEWYS